MHDTAMALGQRFFSTYLPAPVQALVVDVGSLDVNGSLRSVAPPGCRYLGIDAAAGPGVDLVSQDPYALPLEAASADVVVSSSCFEHAEHYWLLFNEIMRILKPGGLFYLNVPSNGLVHRYPVDCWRFYPDAGQALASWARKSGFGTVLLESFVAARQDDIWNDFIAVFAREEAHAAQHARRMWTELPRAQNVLSRDAAGNMVAAQQSERPEDLNVLIYQAKRIKALEAEVARLRASGGTGS